MSIPEVAQNGAEKRKKGVRLFNHLCAAVEGKPISCYGEIHQKMQDEKYKRRISQILNHSTLDIRRDNYYLLKVSITLILGIKSVVI